MPIFNRITYSPVKTSEAYAVFDSSDGSFTFFRDTPGKYTDGQVSGTKTYYTGFEDVTGTPTPSWCTSDRSSQKNTIRTVTFKDKIQPKTCYRWFIGANSLTSITGLDKLDTENATNISRMFDNCTSLTSLDLSSFNTAKVTDMGRMFDNCNALTNLDLSSFNTANVTNMDGMFYKCSRLRSLDLSSFNTAAVTDMSDMFSGCNALTNLDVSSFNTAEVTNMGYMFKECSSLTSLNLSSFNTQSVTDMGSMFQGCSKLKTIYASSLFTTDAVSLSTNMFYVNTSLVGGAGTKYNQNYTDKTYARIDGGTSNPGYFTAILKIVTWASGTDEEIAKMVEAADAGKIKLSDYWKIGDSRSVSLSAMSATNVGESHAAQTVQMVLMNAGGVMLTTGKTCHYVVGLKDCLKEKGYMNSSDTNSGGWNSCKRRTWCNSVFYNAIPTALRPIFKQFKNVTANGSSSSVTTSTDYFALPSEKEVFGSVKCANSTAESSNSQFEWYKTSSNRVKKVNGSADSWWERSPLSGRSYYFCCVISDGSAADHYATATDGISPFGCI